MVSLVHGIDVTAKVQEIADANGALFSLLPNQFNAIFGDPDPTVVKYLFIEARVVTDI